MIGENEEMNSMEFRHLRTFCDRHGLDYQEIDDKLTYWENKDNLQQLSMGAGDIDLLDRPHTRVSSIVLSKREEVRAAKSSAMEYLNTMANEMGLKLMSIRQHKRLTSGRAIIGPPLRQPKIKKSTIPTVRIVIGQDKKKPAPRKKKAYSRSEREIIRWQKVKIKYKLGEWKGGLPKFQERLGKYKASLILGRKFQEPVDRYLKRTGLKRFWDFAFTTAPSREKIGMVTQRKTVARAPLKPKLRKKRQRLHIERAGKTMRVLKKAQENGVRVFSFGDDVWKTKTTRARSGRKRR